jgi:hypothetical protein
MKDLTDEEAVALDEYYTTSGERGWLHVLRHRIREGFRGESH